MTVCDECGQPVVKDAGGGRLEGIDAKVDLCGDHMSAWKNATRDAREEYMTKMVQIERALFVAFFKRCAAPNDEGETP
jgi:hypothetical protein